jgi:hypothetical protein
MKITENEDFQISRKINVKNKESIRKKRLKLQLFIKILSEFGNPLVKKFVRWYNIVVFLLGKEIV